MKSTRYVGAARHVGAYRDQVIAYLEARGFKHEPGRRLFARGGRGKTEPGKGEAFECGCFIPTGAPLYREPSPCKAHTMALFGRWARHLAATSKPSV